MKLLMGSLGAWEPDFWLSELWGWGSGRHSLCAHLVGGSCLCGVFGGEKIED